MFSNDIYITNEVKATRPVVGQVSGGIVYPLNMWRKVQRVVLYQGSSIFHDYKTTKISYLLIYTHEFSDI